MPRTKIKTNVGFVTELMSQSPSGPLMEAFIINAITTEAKRILDIAAQGPIADAFSIINPQTWIDCAQEIQDKLASWYMKPEKAKPMTKQGPTLFDEPMDDTTIGDVMKDLGIDGEEKETERQGPEKKKPAKQK